MKQANIPDVGYEEQHKFPKWHWGKVPKIYRSQMFPAPFAVKNNSPVMLVNTSANDKIEFTDVKVLLSILLVLLFR